MLKVESCFYFQECNKKQIRVNNGDCSRSDTYVLYFSKWDLLTIPLNFNTEFLTKLHSEMKCKSKSLIELRSFHLACIGEMSKLGRDFNQSTLNVMRFKVQFELLRSLFAFHNSKLHEFFIGNFLLRYDSPSWIGCWVYGWENTKQKTQQHENKKKKLYHD